MFHVKHCIKVDKHIKKSYYYLGTTFMFEPGQNWKVAALRISKCVYYFFVVMNMNEKYMKIAYKEALKAYKKGDVPVGCIIVKNNKIISKGYNKKEKKQNAIKHAEIIAIEKACKKLKTWHLDDCILYTTMEPCMMCTGAIIQSRIKKIVYSIKNEQFGYLEKYALNNKKIEIKKDVLKILNYTLVSDFFKKVRK